MLNLLEPSPPLFLNILIHQFIIEKDENKGPRIHGKNNPINISPRMVLSQTIPNKRCERRTEANAPSITPNEMPLDLFGTSSLTLAHES